MKKLIIILILIPIITYSQGGSNYSAFGIGDVESVQGASYWGAGGTAISTPNESAINLINPAMWSNNILTRLQLGYRFQQNNILTEDKSIFQNFGTIDGLNALFVLDTSRGATFGFGINSYSDVNYSIASQFSKVIDDLPVSGKLENIGEGGIKKLYFGASYRIFDFISIGLQHNIFLGNIQRDALTITDQEYAHNSFTGRKNSFSGNNQKIGLNLNYKDFTFGAFFDTPAKLKVNSDLIYISYYNFIASNSTLVDTTFSDTYQIEIPSSLGFGTSYKTGKFLLSADYYTQNYADFNFNQGENSQFKTLNSYALGFSRLGNKSVGASALDKLTYRFGAGYKQLNLSINNTPINETYATFGFTAPFGKSSVFDYAMVLGLRGETTSPLVQEYFARFYFNVSIGEEWFVPFKREFGD